jgi:voltage-gated potassium channel
MFVQEVLAEHSNREIKEVEVRKGCSLIGQTLLQSDIHEKTGVVVLGVGEAGELIIDPPRDFVIKEGNIILGVGKPEEFEKLENIS